MHFTIPADNQQQVWKYLKKPRRFASDGTVIAVQATWIYEPFFGLPFMKIPMTAVATGTVAY